MTTPQALYMLQPNKDYFQTLISEAKKDKIILVNILYREHKKGDKRIMELVKKVKGFEKVYEYEHFENAAKSLTEKK